MRKLIAVACCSLVLMAGCDSFERTTFNTLSSTKSVLDTAQADYEAGTIPKTQCSYSVITDAKTADTVAVQAMVVYEQVKESKGDLATQEAIVVGDLGALAPLVVRVQGVIANPGTCAIPTQGASK